MTYLQYKYQLLYVNDTLAETGGRMWNVYMNRVLACCVIMQLLIILSELWGRSTLTVIATGLIRQRWLDALIAVPPVILLFAFKVYLALTVEQRFEFFEPTQQDEEWMALHTEQNPVKHVSHAARFRHPALQQKLHRVTVHKHQERLATDVLSPYPWLTVNGRHQGGKSGVSVSAVLVWRSLTFP